MCVRSDPFFETVPLLVFLSGGQSAGRAQLRIVLYLPGYNTCHLCDYNMVGGSIDIDVEQEMYVYRQEILPNLTYTWLPSLIARAGEAETEQIAQSSHGLKQMNKKKSSQPPPPPY